MSDSRTRASALIMAATRAASRSLSPKRISEVATVSFSLMTGTVAEPQQRADRAAGIQMPAPLLGVVEGQQDLRDGDAVARQRLLVRMGQLDLPGRRGRLLLLEPQLAAVEAEMAAPHRDGARAHDQDSPVRAGGTRPRRRRAHPASRAGWRRFPRLPEAPSRSSRPAAAPSAIVRRSRREMRARS